MRILFFIESLRAGGKERRIVELLTGLRQYDQLQITLVLTRNEIHYQEVFDLNIPIHVVERRFLKKDPLVFLKFYRLARKLKPDIIHVWGHMVAVYAMPAKWLLKVPLINNEITDSTPNQKLLGKSIVFKGSNRIIANSQAGLKAYNAPMDKSIVIYNGFNLNRLKVRENAGTVRAKFNIDTSFVVAMVASFLAYKDYDTYIKAALFILNEFNDITFLCVGDGDDRAVRKLVPTNRANHIRFLGKQNDVESIMNICDVGVLTTNINVHGEGISNALMEFMALGKPVIATDFGGSVELIENNISGFLISAFAVSELADKIMYLLRNEEARQEMSERAALRIKQKFSIEAMVDSFYHEYVKNAKSV